MAKRNYYVYVIELSKSIWTESTKFRKENPQYNPALECLYVGMTTLTPQKRFEKHKSGAKSKKGVKISAYFAEKYGLYLRPSLYQAYNPQNKAQALKMERELALALKKKRYAVWWN